MEYSAPCYFTLRLHVFRRQVWIKSSALNFCHDFELQAPLNPLMGLKVKKSEFGLTDVYLKIKPSFASVGARFIPLTELTMAVY